MKIDSDVSRSVPFLMLTLQFVHFKLSSACQMKIDSDVSRSVPCLILTLQFVLGLLSPSAALKSSVKDGVG